MDEFVIVCLKCGTKNRVQESRFNDRPICGKCKSPLYSGRIAEVSDDTFESEVIMFPAPVLVCFWSPDCASCKVVIAYLEKIASRYAGGIKIAKLNTKKNGVTTEKYAIGGIPAFLFFKNGTVADKITGVATKEEIEIRLKSVMAEKPKENNK
jgi:thioredoxin 2